MPEFHFESFHPAVREWFVQTFAQPTLPQLQAWPAIKAGRHTLIAAPTGSGKTLAAFLAGIDELIQAGLQAPLPDATQIVYVSPLKALSNDIRRNLEAPLAGIRDKLFELGCGDVEIRTWVRTGDTPASERVKSAKRPPHILVTTPESLYILLTSASGRRMLGPTHTVIVDEIHALANSKRGSHLSLTLARLERLTGKRLRRIGLSATQRPIEEVARYLVGTQQLRSDGSCDCLIIDTGHTRSRDLALELPGAPLEAVMSGEVWQQIYDRLAALIAEHRTTLIFANTRRMAERVARHLSDRLGDDNVTSHHGSMSREKRLKAESRLKNGELKALVATASLELGIDIGDVDLVCQLSSPRSIATFLQRVGRAGHSVSGTSKGRLFPTSRDDLIECAALLDAVRRGELDRLEIPLAPLDVLSQQIVAELAHGDYGEDDLFELVRQAYPYRDLPRRDFDDVIRTLSEGYSTQRGRRSAHIYRDSVNKRLRGRRGAQLTAVTNGGTIPDNADFDVVLEPEGHVIGTLNEDFAIESLQGDIFQLGNHSYRILRVESSKVRVEDARGQPPNIPFWLGEAPGRSDEFSLAVARLREQFAARLDDRVHDVATRGANLVAPAQQWLIDELSLPAAAARQIYDYLAAAYAALGTLPTADTIVIERFFDESGGMQLVIHSPFGSRVNRAWGLALRKRFCRKFNFELQAAASEDAIIVSLTSAHSFPLEDVSHYLNSATARDVLVQALLDAPMFTARWRWNATIALAIPRFRGGRKVPPNLQRMLAEDLVGSVFPDQRACLENIVGEREIPDHPLVRQTIHDCLHEAMDVVGMENVLRRLEQKSIRVVTCDLSEPSPLAQEILNAQPYAFLDDAPLEERRAHAVMARRWLDPKSASELGKLDPEAIARVRDEIWPIAENADELHEATLLLGFLTEAEAATFDASLFAQLGKARRVARVQHAASAPALWAAVERLPQLAAVFPGLTVEPALSVPDEYAGVTWVPESALLELVRSRLEGLGPLTARALANPLGLEVARIDAALLALEVQGSVMRGRFSPQAVETEWCERRLLARIHRYTLNRLRQEIEPVQSADFMRFLFHWQRVTPEQRGDGQDALAAIIDQLAGYAAPAVAWEGDILPARLAEYDPTWLDALCLAGRIKWARLSRPKLANGQSGIGPVRSTPISLTSRKSFAIWRAAARGEDAIEIGSSHAQRVAEHLQRYGASFFDELVDDTGLLRTQVEEALAELVAAGLASADGFSGLRALLIPSSKRRPFGQGKRRHRLALFGIEDAGRWAWLGKAQVSDEQECLEHIARALLRRYGVVFRKLLEREADNLPPWRDLLWVYRSLEARGEIRGGRFVGGFTGEQYALPEAVGVLREIRRKAKSGISISISGADPLNLAGIITPGNKVAALAANRVLYRDGVVIASLSGGEIQFETDLTEMDKKTAQDALLRRIKAPVLKAYL